MIIESIEFLTPKKSKENNITSDVGVNVEVSNDSYPNYDVNDYAMVEDILQSDLPF